MHDDNEIARLLPLTPAAFHILLALAGGDRHGYALLQEIAASGAGQFRVGPGTLYRSLKQLLGLGFIEYSDERPDPALDDERRRYYRLTDRGRRTAQLEAVRLARLVREAESKHLLDGAGGIQGVGQPGLAGLGELEPKGGGR
ncbi:MAG: PadR family transcriptional regulator [Ktedonobacterales bacterium]